jgi:uncharacterized protein (DUF433 family)
LPRPAQYCYASLLKEGKDKMSVLHKNPDIMGGEPVFRGTRVLLDNLIDSLQEGTALDEFLENFPGVSREMAVAALDEARAALAERLPLEQPSRWSGSKR